MSGPPFPRLLRHHPVAIVRAYAQAYARQQKTLRQADELASKDRDKMGTAGLEPATSRV